LIPGVENLSAFYDILHGGFGTPDEGFILIWKNSKRSRQLFDYDMTIKVFEPSFQSRKRYKHELTPETLRKHYPADQPWSRQKLRAYLNGINDLAHARMHE
jgi:hypothetical protein